MLLTWSPHQGGPAEKVIEYLLLERLLKSTMGRKSELIRKPRPELLRGSPPLLEAFIDALPFQNRYRCATMSFAETDIDVEAFNAGATTPRASVGAATRLFLELAFAGVPPHLQPPVLVGTHTHTGRLEITILMPRAIGAPDGRLRSWNPHPPRSRSRDDWDAFVDVVNCEFGWADPRSPMRFSLVSPPSWMIKQAAEHGRLHSKDLTDIADPRFRCWQVIERAVDINPWPRADLIARIDQELRAFGWAVLFDSGDKLSCGAADGSGRVISFRGAAIAGHSALADDPFDAQVAREAELESAPDRLREALYRRACENLNLTRGDAIIPADPADILADLRPITPIVTRARNIAVQLGQRLRDSLELAGEIAAFLVKTHNIFASLVANLKGTHDDNRQGHGDAYLSPSRTARSNNRGSRGRRQATDGRTSGQSAGHRTDDEGRRQRDAFSIGPKYGPNRSAGPDDGQADGDRRPSGSLGTNGAIAHGASWRRGHWLRHVGQLARALGPCSVRLVIRDEGEAVIVRHKNRYLEIPIDCPRPDNDWTARAHDRLGLPWSPPSEAEDNDIAAPDDFDF